MKIKNLPTIDAGYWVAIVAASMCGANSGDLAAGPLGLGHVNGLLPMAVIFLAIVVAEKMLNWTTVAFYWGAIIVLRTMATNLADLMGHDLKMSYRAMQVGLIALIMVMLLIDKARGAQATGVVGRDGVWRSLSATDWSYWITMLAAGTLSTVIGDWLAEKDNLAFGPLRGLAHLRTGFSRCTVSCHDRRQDDEALVLGRDRRLSHAWHQPWRCVGVFPAGFHTDPIHGSVGQHHSHWVPAGRDYLFLEV